jgi:hypothetical protein
MSSIITVLIHSLVIPSLKRLIPTTKSHVDDPTKLVRPDLILLGSSAWLQPSEPPQLPTMTIAFVIALIVSLFILCPYLIGKVLSKPEWREEGEAMEAKLPQWDATDNWANLFPRYLAEDKNGPD